MIKKLNTNDFWQLSAFKFLQSIIFSVYTCTVNWFCVSVPRTLPLFVMSVPCTFFSLVMSVPCTFLPLVMSISVIFLSVCLQYRCTQTSLKYMCTQNQFTVCVYTKPVYSTGIHKITLWNMQTQNRLECTFLILC